MLKCKQKEIGFWRANTKNYCPIQQNISIARSTSRHLACTGFCQDSVRGSYKVKKGLYNSSLSGFFTYSPKIASYSSFSNSLELYQNAKRLDKIGLLLVYIWILNKPLEALLEMRRVGTFLDTLNLSCKRL